MDCCFRSFTFSSLLGTMKPKPKVKHDPFDKDYWWDVPDEDFPLFKVEKDYSENRFRKTPISKYIDQIYMESETFEDRLPESIYLRTYNERPDLFQAAIVGLPNTPYQDGIYVFDLKLSENYPKTLPSVIYHYYDEHKLRPSMIDSYGRFRNTDDIFNNLESTESMLLQVLYRIQHVVLNAKPYQRNSPSFYVHHLISECLLTHHLYAYQSMVDVLDDTPSLFRRLVYYHFSDREKAICREFDENLRDHMFYGESRGYLSMVDSQMKNDHCYALPLEFTKVQVAKLRGNLARAFAENQVHRMIALRRFGIDMQSMAHRLGVPYVGTTMLD